MRTSPASCTTPMPAAQHTSIRYSNRLFDAGALASICSVGASFDSAIAESVIGLERPSVSGQRVPGAVSTISSSPPWTRCTGSTRTGFTAASAYVSPAELEAEHYRQINARQQPLLGEPSLH